MFPDICRNIITVLNFWKKKDSFNPPNTLSNSNSFPDLSATSEAEDIEVYETHLSELLEHRPKVKEIAITSPYGGGKSSFIDSYFKVHEKYNITKISLANFIFEESQSNQSTGENTEPLAMAKIEKSILQQLLYRLKASSLPNSRFRKIMGVKLPLNVVMALPIGLLIFALSCVLILFSTSSISITLNAFFVHIGASHFIKIFSIFYLFIFPCLCVKDIYIHLCKYNIKQLNIAKAEVTLDSQNNESVFNIYLEEIIYYFKTSKSDVVVFEDLDRLNNPQIFIKLKEINTILNNCNDIASPVRFIYALKDDIFTGKDRTKFFDAIIPIVPISNRSNSYAHFKKLLSEAKLMLGISDTFLRDVAPFVEDMRMHKNIVSEFGIYRENLKAHLSENEYHRLLSFIIYKNVYCQDFALLQENKGALVAIINKKNEMRKHLIEALQFKIDTLNQKIDNISNEKLKSIEELNTLYVFKIMESLNNFSITTLCDQHPTVLVQNENFSAAWNNNNPIVYRTNRSYHHEHHSNFRAYNDKIEGGYSNRLANIEEDTKNTIASYRAEIDALTNRQGQLSSYSVKQLLKKLSSTDINTVLDENKIEDTDLLIHLLERGYVDEQYHLYICPFHEGDVTKAEMGYILAVKSNDISTNDFNLVNLSAVYQYFNFEDYSNEAIFHPTLINYLIKIGDVAHLNLIIEALECSVNVNEKNIYKTLALIENKVKWLTLIVDKWANYSHKIINSDYLSRHEKDTLLFEAINALNLQSLNKISTDDISLEALKLHISEVESVASFIPKDNSSQQYFIRKLVRLGIVFDSIPTGIIQNNLLVDFINSQLFKCTYENYYYLYSVLKPSSESLNFTYQNLLTIGDEVLYEGIHHNIDDFLENILLKHEVPLGDNSYGIELLNDDQVRFDIKIKLIKSCYMIISTITDITDSNLWPMLLDTQKIVCSWQNVLAYTNEEDTALTNLSDYINIHENTLKLVNEDISNDRDTSEPFDLFIGLLLDDRVPFNTFKELAPKLHPYWSSTPLNYRNISKIELLIKWGLLSFPDIGLDDIAENIPKLIPTFIEYNYAPMKKVGLFNEVEYQERDILYLLKSKQLSSKEKMEFCQFIHGAYFDQKHLSKELFKELTELYLDTHLYKVSMYILDAVINSPQGDISTKVKMIAHQMSHISLEQLHIYLEQLGSPYLDLSKTKSYTKFDATEENIALASALADQGYFSISTTKQSANQIRLNVKGLFKV